MRYASARNVPHAGVVICLGMIPFGESQPLFAAFAGRSGVALTEFHLFQRADPTKRKLSPFALLRELVKFSRFAGSRLRHAS